MINRKPYWHTNILTLNPIILTNILLSCQIQWVRTFLGGAKSLVSENEERSGSGVQVCKRTFEGFYYPEWALKKVKGQVVKDRSGSDIRTSQREMLFFHISRILQLKKDFLKHNFNVSFKRCENHRKILVQHKDKPDKKRQLLRHLPHKVWWTWKTQ